MTELNFKGKEFVYNHHLAVPFRPLTPDASKGIDAVALDGNLIIHGDNLHALKALLPLYAGKVDCIFIDPPYNTGNEHWSYNDNVNSPMIKEWLSANPIGIEDGLRHDKWCAMMWPRLRLLHELLADDGSISDSIPENASVVEAQLQRISLNGADNDPITAETVTASAETLRFDPAYATRMISDIVQSPFVGREIVGRVVARLTARGFDAAKLGKLAGVILEELRKGLTAEQDARGEALFGEGVASGAVQFRLRLDDKNWRMPFSMETTLLQNARQLLYGSKGARSEPVAVDATSDIPDGDYAVPLDKASVMRPGSTSASSPGS